MSALTAISVGTAAYGAYSKYKQSKQNQGQMMEPGNIMAPEDKWAPGARQENYDYMSKMMSDVGQGIDPMQTRRDAVMQNELTGARRNMFGSEGDRNQSVSGMGEQALTQFGGNAASVLAQKKKDKSGLQFQLDDIRARINREGTSYMEGISKFAPEMMNKLRTGGEVSGTYGPQFIPGAESSSPIDMEGIQGMAESFLGNTGVQKGIAGVSGFLKGGYKAPSIPTQGGTTSAFRPMSGGNTSISTPSGYTGSRVRFDSAGNPMSG